MDNDISDTGPDVRRTLRTARTSIVVYGAIGAVALTVVVGLAVAGSEVTSFLWGRAGGMVASAVVTYVLTVLAARGRRWAHVRLRIITVLAPVAIVAVDAIPGALPAWFVALQVAGALALVPAAYVVNRSALRAAGRTRS